jgi:hypothetical protein
MTLWRINFQRLAPNHIHPRRACCSSVPLELRRSRALPVLVDANLRSNGSAGKTHTGLCPLRTLIGGATSA